MPTVLFVGTTPRSVEGVPCELDDDDCDDSPLTPILYASGIKMAEIYHFRLELDAEDKKKKDRFDLEMYVDEDAWLMGMSINTTVTPYCRQPFNIRGPAVLDTRNLSDEDVNRITYHLAKCQSGDA